MTAHLRARAARAGALVVLVAGIVAVAASPAQAAPPDVQITSLSSTTIPAGGSTTVQYTVANPNTGPPVDIQVQVSGMDCGGDCTPVLRLQPNGSQDFTASLTAGPVDTGQTKTVRVQITATANGETGTATQDVTVKGPDAPPQVRRVSGRVRDQDGRAVSGAQILMQDSANHRYTTTTDGAGEYEFTSSDENPISPGSLSIGAGKDGFETSSVNVSGTAGKTVNVPLTLKPVAAVPSPTPSATPSQTPTPSPTPSATEEATATDEPTEEPAPAVTGAAASSADSGSHSLIYIIIGGLLVAAGVGAIVLVLMRRKGTDDDDPSDGDPYGAPDAARIGAPLGGRRVDDATVPGVGLGLGAASLADAQTMFQPAVPAIPSLPGIPHTAIPVADEFADPYGVPAGQGWSPPPGAAEAAGAAAAVSTPYGGGTYGGAHIPAQVPHEDPYGAYADRRGYADQQRFDEPTGMYRPEPGADQQSGHHDSGRGGSTAYQPDGYDRAQAGYGQWGPPVDGLDRGHTYGPAGGGTYGPQGVEFGGPGREAPYGGGAYGTASGSGAYGGDSGGGTYGDSIAYGGGGTYGDDSAGTAHGGGATALGGYGGQRNGSYRAEDLGGYEQRVTYGRPEGYGPGSQPNGYEQDRGGYGEGDPREQQQGGGHDGSDRRLPPDGRHGGQSRPQAPDVTRPGQRRPPDWLDD